MILTQNTQETYTTCWRQVRIYTVPHILTEVHSQLYKLQIPVRGKGRADITLHYRIETLRNTGMLFEPYQSSIWRARLGTFGNRYI